MFRASASLIVSLAAAWLALSACASSGGWKCKPDDNEVALCQSGSHEECETRDDGCKRCTCVPDRLEELEHGPVGPQ